MKKIIALALTLVMVFAMSIPAAAETLSADGSTTQTDIYASYVSSGENIEVISVDVEFGAMEFTYVNSTTGTWDPTSHTYPTTGATVGWNAVGNTVTVTNHSNTEINVKVVAEVNDSLPTELTATTDMTLVPDGNGFVKLNTAEGTTLAEAPAETWTVNLNYTGSDITTAITETSTAIGSVTVTISNTNG